MKAVILNGSPRKGNTLDAIEAFAKGASVNNEVEIINCHGLNVAPCKGCGACGMKNGCVDTDDTNEIIGKIVAADFILFASPVYWWGITAQLKTVIDKCYSQGMKLKNKKIGVVIVGGAAENSPQYKLIEQQFDMMQAYLSWDKKFYKGYSANARGELAANEAVIAEMEALGKAL